jgi:hypothetical protein
LLKAVERLPRQTIPILLGVHNSITQYVQYLLIPFLLSVLLASRNTLKVLFNFLNHLFLLLLLILAGRLLDFVSHGALLAH